MSRGRKIREERILNLFLSVCQGLHALHTSGNEGLAHRDIKVCVPYFLEIFFALEFELYLH